VLTRLGLYRLYWRMARAFGVHFPPHPYEDVLQGIVASFTRWLDIGCGTEVLNSWRMEQELVLVQRAKRITGIDPYLPSLRLHRSVKQRVCGSVSDLPFEDSGFDLVTASMVVEHLDAPLAQFREVARVLEPGGRFVFFTPNARGYTVRLIRLVPERLKATISRVLEGRPPEDLFPTHYRANTEPAIRAFAAEAGLEVVEVRYVLSPAAFSMVPPLAAVELCFMRLLMRPSFAKLRPRLVAILRKPD